MINRLIIYPLFRALLKAHREIKDLTMTRDELFQKIDAVKAEAAALRSDRDALAAENATLKAGQDLADVGVAVDGIATALQPQPIAADPVPAQ